MRKIEKVQISTNISFEDLSRLDLKFDRLQFKPTSEE